MARDGSAYICQTCGAVHSKWAGQCTACSAWNSLVEERTSAPPGGLAPSKATKTRGLNFETLEAQDAVMPRIVTGIEEFDRVCGGGVAQGSAILLGGDPGVGKSTLLLQVCASAAARGARCAYISGEEAVDQIRGRAARMGLSDLPGEAGFGDGAARHRRRPQARGLRPGGDRLHPDRLERHARGRAGLGHPGAGGGGRVGAPGQAARGWR
ncbi:MAG: ATPase domain-containing protein [Caulobacteraceae bacterium]